MIQSGSLRLFATYFGALLCLRDINAICGNSEDEIVCRPVWCFEKISESRTSRFPVHRKFL